MRDEENPVERELERAKDGNRAESNMLLEPSKKQGGSVKSMHVSKGQKDWGKIGKRSSSSTIRFGID